MPRLKPEFEICSFGLYTAWDRESKELPKIRKHTLEIHAETGVEFGLILSVKKQKEKYWNIGSTIHHLQMNKGI